ncbi:hypothetical protein [Streptomyces sp. NRRL F-2664]|uniref:hypothetical protein n=1 Tax=Streptomyces sp. NRRL F-2664 TaxID=1463842 RepID=UPI00131C4A5B|nr:hypothetical protein [Streptomyces sp. NRRL F-2664]
MEADESLQARAASGRDHTPHSNLDAYEVPARLLRRGGNLAERTPRLNPAIKAFKKTDAVSAVIFVAVWWASE